ncbi:MAG TPA: hypothetical protein V6C89_12060 [Drouetiella sp.]|jgi:hypothetical protein
MKPVINAQSLKMIGGCIIVAGACLIMFPDLVGYMGSIGKLLIIVLVAILSAALVTRMFYKLKNQKQTSTANPQQPATAGTDTTSDT